MHPDVILQKSICKNCKKRFSRLIIPVVKPHKEYLEEVFELPEIVDEDYKIHNHICMELSADIDTIVVECTHYSPKQALFK